LASAPHAKKRILADYLIAAKSTLSNRELAGIGGVSHTYIANRRRITKNWQHKAEKLAGDCKVFQLARTREG